MQSLFSFPIRGLRRTLAIPVMGLALSALAACGPAEVAVPPVVVQASALTASGGMVVSAYPDASEAGAEVLRAGGNAVDAAIATGLALAVTHPSAGNIGGGGFMIIRFPEGEVTAIDFREKAPLAAFGDMFVDENGEYSRMMHHRSHLAVGVPGTVAGFELAHQKYGASEWADIVEPSVVLARDGFALTERLAESLERMLPRFEESYPASLAAFSKNGEAYTTGETMTQPDLAATLIRIRDEGRDGFYKGETARLIVEEMVRGEGMITEEDLAKYQAKERVPIQGTYRGFEVTSMPPPSSGGIAIVEMLNMLEGYDLAAMGHNSPEYVHHLTEAMRRAYRDRAQFLADADFFDVPVEMLISKAHADELRATIDPTKASVSLPTDIEMAYESPETTHYSVVDGNGMAVSVTYTLEGGYGSFITVPGGGFLLNNEMGDFNGRPGLTDSSGLIGSMANIARPEQRMLSSMTPTIIAKDGALVAVIGSPGGRTIINTVLQIALNTMEFGMDGVEAVAGRRLHHQWLPAAARLEEGLMTQAEAAGLEAMGHTITWSGRQGAAHSIFVDAQGDLVGVPDVRVQAASAAGYSR